MGERAEPVSLEITGLSVGKLPREHGADRAGGQPMVPIAFFFSSFCPNHRPIT